MAKRGNSYFTLYESTRKIILREYSAQYRGLEYEKNEKVYMYEIVESLGDIKVVDEQGRAIICLTSDHEILKIDSAAHKQNRTVEFEGEAELLDYKEPKQPNSYPALFQTNCS